MIGVKGKAYEEFAVTQGRKLGTWSTRVQVAAPWVDLIRLQVFVRVRRFCLLYLLITAFVEVIH
jgi:hypothetical protein